MHYVKRSLAVSRLSRRSSILERARTLRRVFSKKVRLSVSFFWMLGIVNELHLAKRRAQCLRDRIQSILNDNRRGEIMRAGIRLAIFGPPNVGKSSLLNFLGTMALPSHHTAPLLYALTKRVGSSARGRDSYPYTRHDARHFGALTRYRRVAGPCR